MVYPRIWMTTFRCDSERTGGDSQLHVLKVSAKSRPNAVAGALADYIREDGAAVLQAIGPGALNQAVKAVAIARGFLASNGIDLICTPGFTDLRIEGRERTAIRLICEPRRFGLTTRPGPE